VTDADSDKQAHESIAVANAAMPNPMSDREFRERVIAIADDNLLTDEEVSINLEYLASEWRRRNG